MVQLVPALSDRWTTSSTALLQVVGVV